MDYFIIAFFSLHGYEYVHDLMPQVCEKSFMQWQ